MIDLDLDALAPEGKKIKYGEKVITVQPATMEQLTKMVALGQRLQETKKKNKEGEEEIDADRFKEVMDSLHQIIFDLIPDFKGSEFNIDQIYAIIELVVDMAVPKQTKELEARGITIDSPKPQAE